MEPRLLIGSVSVFIKLKALPFCPLNLRKTGLIHFHCNRLTITFDFSCFTEKEG